MSGEPTAAELAEIASRYAAVNWHEAWKEQPAEIEWLVEPFLEAGTVNALFGPPGTGKSLFTLEIALRLVRAGHVIVYMDQENRITDLVERLQAFGAEPDELDRLRLYSFAGLPALDTVAGGVHLLALAATAGAALVVIDTTSRMVQGKENDADTFLALYRCSLVPLKARGVTVLRLDHPGKDETRGQRGSSAKEGDVDTIWKLVQVTPATFRLEREKSRSGHGEASVEMHRRFSPLRHEWAVRRQSPADILRGQLETLGIPPEAGRPAVRKALEAAGIKVSNAQLTEAIRLRHPGHLWELARRLARDAGIEAWDQLSPHCLRHSAITFALDADAALRDVQDYAGHKDPPHHPPVRPRPGQPGPQRRLRGRGLPRLTEHTPGDTPWSEADPSRGLATAAGAGVAVSASRPAGLSDLSGLSDLAARGQLQPYCNRAVAAMERAGRREHGMHKRSLDDGTRIAVRCNGARRWTAGARHA